MALEMKKRDVFRGNLGAAITLDTKALSEDGEFEGYAVTFGNVDNGDDVVVSGAFRESLVRRPASRIKMLWQHDMTRPIGVWSEMREDDNGLRCKGRILKGTKDGADAYEFIKSGAIDGLSIGYRTKVEEYDRERGVRMIKAVDLFEVSIVTMPMNELATIDSVKSAVDALENLSDAERLLREAVGFSRKEATDFVSKVAKIAQREAGDDQRADVFGELKGLADRIRALA